MSTHQDIKVQKVGERVQKVHEQQVKRPGQTGNEQRTNAREGGDMVRERVKKSKETAKNVGERNSKSEETDHNGKSKRLEKEAPSFERHHSKQNTLRS
jgi:hypothetical protein